MRVDAGTLRGLIMYAVLVLDQHAKEQLIERQDQCIRDQLDRLASPGMCGRPWNLRPLVTTSMLT